MAWGGDCEIVSLKNGEFRRREEIADRPRRLRILQRYGLAPREGGRAGARKRAPWGEDEGKDGDYDDDAFEGEVSSSAGLLVRALPSGRRFRRAPEASPRWV